MTSLYTHQEKKERSQISKARNERGDATPDTTELQRIIRDYYEQLYTNKLDNPEEMDKFLETYTKPRLNHNEIENWTRLIELVIKNLPTNKSLGPNDMTGEFYQIIKEELITILLRLFKK